MHYPVYAGLVVVSFPWTAVERRGDPAPTCILHANEATDGLPAVNAFLVVRVGRKMHSDLRDLPFLQLALVSPPYRSPTKC